MLLLAVLLGALFAREVQAFYNPSSGRWLSRDPIGEEGFEALGFESSSLVEKLFKHPNPYLFCANNPITAIDILGLRLGDMPGEHAIPGYNPPSVGQKCCCSPPSRITGRRTDWRPYVNWSVGFVTQWVLFMSVYVEVHDNPDCFRDVEVQWTRCWGGGGAGYMGCGTSNFPKVTTTLGIQNMWLTTARINYLTCENGVWTKKRSIAPLGYIWTGWGWEFSTPSGPVDL
jgi:RHS repeat-associated protein